MVATGAGIGEVIARRFATDGTRVALLDWDGNQVVAVASDFNTSGTGVVICCVDVDIDVAPGTFRAVAVKQQGQRSITPTASPGPKDHSHDEPRSPNVAVYGPQIELTSYHTEVRAENVAKYLRDAHSADLPGHSVSSTGQHRETAVCARGWSGQGPTRASVVSEAPWSTIEAATW